MAEETTDILQDEPKLSVKDFAAKIKAKYPQYASIEDNELTQKILAKYPDYASQVDLGVDPKKKSPAQGGALPSSLPASSASDAIPSTSNPDPSQASVFTGQPSNSGFRTVASTLVKPKKTPTQSFEIDQTGTSKDDIARDKKETKRLAARPGYWSNTIPQVTHALTTALTKPIAGVASLLRDNSNSGMAVPELYDKDGNLTEYGKKTDAGENRDVVGRFIIGLDAYNNETDNSDYENPLPHTFLGNTASGLIHIAPDIAITALAPEAKAAEGVTMLNALKGAISNPFTKLLAFKGAVGGYDEAKQKGETAGDASLSAVGGAASGAVEGATMHLLSGLAGDVISPRAYRSLTQTGLLKGGKFTKAGVDAASDAFVFGAFPVASSLVQGKPINIEEIQSGVGIGLAFGGMKALKTFDEFGVPERIAQDVLNDRRVVGVENFMKASPEAINEAYEMPDNSADFSAKAIEYAHKTKNEPDLDKKNQLAAAASAFSKTSDIKGVTEAIVHDKEGFINSITESNISEEQKRAVIDKVNSISEGLPERRSVVPDPIEVERTEVSGRITSIDSDVKNLQQVIFDTPSNDRSSHYVQLNDLIGKRLEAQNRLFDIEREDAENAGMPKPAEPVAGSADELGQGVSQPGEEITSDGVKYFTDVAASEPAAVGFTTAKGSTYEMHDDGSTTRNKAERPEHGPDEKGPQPRSRRTFYLTEEQANVLGEIQATPGKEGQTYSIVKNANDELAIAVSENGGKAKILKRSIVKPSKEPAVGMIPVEIWNGSSQPHFGNKITDIKRAEPAAVEETRVETPEAAAATDPARQHAIDLISHGLIHQETATAGETNARFDLGMTSAEKKKAVIDINKGKFDTAPAKKLIAKVMEFEANGSYPIIEGTGGAAVRSREASPDEMRADLESIKNYKVDPDVNVEDINQGLAELGFTYEDFKEYEEFRSGLDEQRTDGLDTGTTGNDADAVQGSGNVGENGADTATGGEAAQAEPAGPGDGVKPHKIANDLLGETEIIGFKEDGTISVKLADGTVDEIPLADRELFGIKDSDINIFKIDNGLVEGVKVDPKAPKLEDRISDIAKKIFEKKEEFTAEEITLAKLYPDQIEALTERMVNDQATADDDIAFSAADHEGRENGKDYYRHFRGEALIKVARAKRELTKAQREMRKQGENKGTPDSKKPDWMKRMQSPLTPESIGELKIKLAEMQKRYREEKVSLQKKYLYRDAGANLLIERLSRSARYREISQEQADLAIDLIRMNPDLYRDLSISITRKEKGETADGWYATGSQLMKVFKNSGELTATHELLHHTERFLPHDIRSKILKEWFDNLQDYKTAIKKSLKDEKKEGDREYYMTALTFLEMAEAVQLEPDQAVGNEIRKQMKEIYHATLDSDFYQLMNPSEWWTVNASKKFRELQSKPKADTWIAKAKDWYEGLVKSLTNVFGLNRIEAVEKGLKAVMNGDTLPELEGSLLSRANRVFNADENKPPKQKPGELLADYSKRYREYLEKEKARKAGQPEPAPPEPATLPVEEADVPTWTVEDETLKDKWGSKFYDDNNRIQKIQKAIEMAGGTINERTDFYTEADLQGAKVAENIRQLREQMVKSRDKTKPSFFERMKGDKVSKVDLDKFLQASHVEEYNRVIAGRRRVEYEKELARLEGSLKDANDNDNYRGAANYEKQIDRLKKGENPKFQLMEDGASGMTNAEAKNLLADFEAEGKTDQLQKYADEFIQEVSNRQLEVQLDTGVIDTDTYNNLKTQFQGYVSFQVEDYLQPREGRNLKKNRSTGISKVDNLIRRAKGSTERTIDQRVSPTTFGLVQLEKAYIEGGINKTSNVLYNLVEQNPNSEIFEIVAPKFAPTYNSKGRVIGFREITPQTTINNSVQLYRDGRKMYVELKDPTLKRQIKKEGTKRIGWYFGTVLDTTNSYMRTVSTIRNPEFWVSNFVKDIQSAGFNISTEKIKGLAKNSAKGVLPALRAISRYEHGKDAGEWGKTFERYLEAGGRTNIAKPGTDIEKMASIEKDIEGLSKGKNLITGTQALVEWLSVYGDASELATRVSVFKAASDLGMSDQQAATMSRNASINFNRKGEWSPMAGQMFLMFNGAMQGKIYLAKKLYTSKLARKIYGTAFAAGALSAVANYRDNNDDQSEDDYGAISDFDKQNNYIFRKPGGGFFMIPAGHGYNVPFYMGVKTAELIMGKADAGEAAMGSAQVMFNAFSPVANATLAQTIVPTEPARWGTQYLQNINASGSPIYKENKGMARTAPDSHNHFGRTDKKFVWMSQGMNRLTGGTGVKSGAADVSPDVMEWVYQTATGGVGRFIERVPDAAASISQHAAQKVGLIPESIKLEPVDIKQVPILRRFYTAGRPENYRSKLFSTLEKSGNNEINGEDATKFYKAAGGAFAHGQITGEEYSKYVNVFMNNQMRLKFGDALPDAEADVINPLMEKPKKGKFKKSKEE